MSDETLAQKLTGRKDGTPEQAQEMVNALVEAASLAESQNQALREELATTQEAYRFKSREADANGREAENKAAILNAIEALLDVDDEHTGWDRIVALQERAEKAEALLRAIEPEKLRYIARSLDILTGFVGPILAAGLVTVNGETLAKEDRDTLFEWVNGTQQQDDLMTWANALSPTQETDPE